MIKIFLLFAGVVWLSACQPVVPPDIAGAVSVNCPETRPEACTMEYDPVCGSLADGSSRTFSNACSACSEPDVTSYVTGECN